MQKNLALPREPTNHLVTPLTWPFLATGEPPPPVPLRLHGRYSHTDEATLCGMFFHHHQEIRAPLLPHHPLQRRRHLPLDFHWESQSLTRESSPTGQRYIHHRELGSRVILFVREENKRGGVTMPFLCLG